MGVGGQRQARPRYPREMNLVLNVQKVEWATRTGLDGYGKSRPPPVFDPRIVQPVASRYTD